jgi:vacuolar-type H+-ATPase subunit B/Vma2
MKTETMKKLAVVTILRTNGQDEEHHVGRSILLNWCQRMIGADTIDTVNLRDGRIMLVDDVGLIDGKPINPAATKLYHSVCKPGTTNPIAGDVAIAWDKDFA